MAKKAASPRKVMTGRLSSVGCEIEAGLEDEVDASAAWRAAALPRDPWNWVVFDPQPTLMNLSALSAG